MMAERRPDAVESSRSSLSPDIRTPHHNDYSRSAEDRKNLISLKGSRTLDSSETIDNSNMSKESPKAANGMTEIEISSLVHNALIRARQATKSFSPRAKAYQSVSPTGDAITPSSSKIHHQTGSTLSKSNSSSKARPPVYSPTALASPATSKSSVHSFSSQSRKTISVPRLNHDHKLSPVSNPSTPGLTIRGDGSFSSIDGFQTPNSTMIDATSQLSNKPSAQLYESLVKPTSTDLSASSGGTTNSSDDIIKRVEEEIANARKAAREATRRLAGVSANFMSGVEKGRPRSLDAVPTSSNRKKKNDGDIDAQLSMLASRTGSSSPSTDPEDNFDSALNVIGEEFDDIAVNERSEVLAKDYCMHSTIFDKDENSSRNKSASRNEFGHRQSGSSDLDTLELEKIKSRSNELYDEPVGDSKSYNEKVTITVVKELVPTESRSDEGVGLLQSFSQDIGLAVDDSKPYIENVPMVGDVDERAVVTTVFGQKNEKNGNDSFIAASSDDASKSKLDKSKKFNRLLSIGDCAPGDVPGDEFNALLTEKSGQDKNNDSVIKGGIKTAMSTNMSFNDSRRDELEAVLSDEREQDDFQANTKSRSITFTTKDASVPNPDDEATSVARDEKLDHDQPNMDTEAVERESLSTTQKLANNVTVNFLWKSDDQEEKKELDSTSSEEKLDHKELTAILQVTTVEEVKDSGDQTSQDTADSEATPCVETVDKSIEEYENAAEAKEVVEEMRAKSFEDTNMESKCAVSKDQESFVDITTKSSMVSKESNNVAVDEMASVESRDKSSEDVEATADTKKEICGDFSDQATETIDNKSHPTAQLLSNLSIKEDKNTLPNDHTATPSPNPVKEATTSKTDNICEAIDDTDDTSYGKKVQFKNRYPIPQKMKKFRQPSEIIFDNQLEKPSDKLWYSMPKSDLEELLEAVTGSSIQRRSNACGALKVLSTQTKNQMMLVRTQGFMDTLVFAISENKYVKREMKAGTAARTRAVNTVLNVSARKDNRYHILIHPGLRESIVQCIIEDNAEARELACAVLATLAKSQHCRELMVKTEKLVDALATVMKMNDSLMPDSDTRTYLEEKVDYSGDDERSREDSKTTASSSSSLSASSTFEDFSVGTQKEEDFEMGNRTRMNACAALLHLSKECVVSQELCASDTLLDSLISCCTEVQNPMHTKCLEILANISRFPHNNVRLVNYPGLIDALLTTGSQEGDTDRLWSMRIFQNLSSEPSAKAKLANSVILELLSTNLMRKQYGEQLAATSTIYNISTEPGAVVPLTNTKNVVATLVHVSHNPASNMEVRTIACDALATLGLWLQTLSSSGSVPDGMKAVPLPSFVTTGWQRWDE